MLSMHAMMLLATPRPRHSGMTAREASSYEPSLCGLTCPHPISSFWVITATTNRRHTRPVGLILTWWTKALILIKSDLTAGRIVKELRGLCDKAGWIPMVSEVSWSIASSCCYRRRSSSMDRASWGSALPRDFFITWPTNQPIRVILPFL